MEPTYDRERPPAGDETAAEAADRSPLIFCGMCGGLNPATSHYCAACGSTLVDAFHGTEGLRVYERPDSASRLVEITPAGSELDIVEEDETPEDFVRVRLPSGKLGYIRLTDVERLAGPSAAAALDAPDINRAARGCVTPGAALGSLVLLIVVSTTGLFLMRREDWSSNGFLALVSCLVIAPLILLTVGLYLYARDREERRTA